MCIYVCIYTSICVCVCKRASVRFLVRSYLATVGMPPAARQGNGLPPARGIRHAPPWLMPARPSPAAARARGTQGSGRGSGAACPGEGAGNERGEGRGGEAPRAARRVMDAISQPTVATSY